MLLSRILHTQEICCKDFSICILWKLVDDAAWNGQSRAWTSGEDGKRGGEREKEGKTEIKDSLGIHLNRDGFFSMQHRIYELHFAAVVAAVTKTL